MYKTKKYEYRTWRTKYRGKLLICSSKSPVIEGMLSGHALCIVELKDVHEITKDNYKKYGCDTAPNRKLYAWELKVISKVQPFPVKGKLSFFEVDDNLIKECSPTNEDTHITEEDLIEMLLNYDTYIPGLDK